MLVQERPVKPPHEAVGLGPPDPGLTVLYALQLQEKLVGMSIGAAAVFPSVVTENLGDTGAMLVKGGQDILIKQVHRRHWQFGGSRPQA